MTDKERIIKEIERLKRDAYNNVFCTHIRYALDRVISFIDSLPEESVSEDLDRASREWLRPRLDEDYANYGEDKMMELTRFDGYAMLDAIEFGAQWQANKGVTKEAVIGMATEEIAINVSQPTLDALDLCAGDKVIIQLRKKED